MESGALKRQSGTRTGIFHAADLTGEADSAPRTGDIPGAAAKRAIDLVVSLAALVVLSPLLLLIALAIKLDSRGPVIFSQLRNGLRGERFVIYKFRSMTNPPSGGLPSRHDERRITRVGRWLRASNLDELPQLWNVFKGSMSLVGPRPHPLELDATYRPRLTGYTGRNDVTPGITGWAQVNGFRGTVRTEEAMRGRLEHDLFYIANRSLWLDCKILVLTVFSPKAYRNAR